ncbi:hypothetical protein [Nannocystis pusilla]|uniref:hypothetical protein n=1 Tax=Nannocystis pusilla TaxID=889268 RepID=UPI003DA2B6A5
MVETVSASVVEVVTSVSVVVVVVVVAGPEVVVVVRSGPMVAVVVVPASVDVAVAGAVDAELVRSSLRAGPGRLAQSDRLAANGVLGALRRESSAGAVPAFKAPGQRLDLSQA